MDEQTTSDTVETSVDAIAVDEAKVLPRLFTPPSRSPPLAFEPKVIVAVDDDAVQGSSETPQEGSEAEAPETDASRAARSQKATVRVPRVATASHAPPPGLEPEGPTCGPTGTVLVHAYVTRGPTGTMMMPASVERRRAGTNTPRPLVAAACVALVVVAGAAVLLVKRGHSQVASPAGATSLAQTAETTRTAPATAPPAPEATTVATGAAATAMPTMPATAVRQVGRTFKPRGK
jgi:hypothetical protein